MNFFFAKYFTPNNLSVKTFMTFVVDILTTDYTDFHRWLCILFIIKIKDSLELM